jgi:hypothetical protein
VHFCEGLSYLPSKLRAIDWFGYPLKSLPMSFSHDKLVDLNMPCSHVEEVWKGKKVRSLVLMQVCYFYPFQIS